MKIKAKSGTKNPLEFIKTKNGAGYSVSSIREFLPHQHFKELNAWLQITERKGIVHEGRYIIIREDFEWFCRIVGINAEDVEIVD